MSDFSDDWLALRAPADSQARADGLVHQLGIDRADGIEVLDLGCGTGANLRHLAPLLAAAGAREQCWTCVDLDATLLDKLPARTATWATHAGLEFATRARGFGIGTRQVSSRGPGWRCRVRPLQLDLTAALERLPLPVGGLVTASALLDLVSAPWLGALLGRCRDAGCRLLFALSYDGRCMLGPAHAEDRAVIDLVNRHQLSDKGFGPALGPVAASHAAACCEALGYRAETASSAWRIGADQPALQRSLIDGWRRAALELDAANADRINAWNSARIRMIEAGSSRLWVGHRDLVAKLEPNGAVVATPGARTPGIDPDQPDDGQTGR